MSGPLCLISYVFEVMLYQVDYVLIISMCVCVCGFYYRVLALTVASELAAPKANGSGTFLPALIDELGALTAEKLAENAKIEIVSC